MPIQENKGHYCGFYAWYTVIIANRDVIRPLQSLKYRKAALRGQGGSNSTGQAVFTPPEVSGRGCKPWAVQ